MATYTAAFTCDVCDEEFDDEGDAERHCKNCTPEPKCIYCKNYRKPHVHYTTKKGEKGHGFIEWCTKYSDLPTYYEDAKDCAHFELSEE